MLTKRGLGSVVAAWDGVFDAPLLGDLRHAFRPSAEYWAAHEYPTDGFFSYNLALAVVPTKRRREKRRRR